MLEWAMRRKRLGRPRTPAMPSFLILTDRLDGREYVLTHEGDPGSLTPLLSNNLPRTETERFGTTGGPYANGFRLYIEAAILKSEPVNFNFSPPIYTRRGVSRDCLLVTVDETGAIQYTETTV